jgi:hypothetical protein
MQNSNDRAVTTKTIEANAEWLGQAIKEHGVTVDRMVALSYNPNKKVFLFTYQDASIKVHDKMNFRFVRHNLPSILTWTKVNGAYFFETINADEATIKALAPWIKQLDSVRDLNGNLVDEIHFVGADANLARQHVLTSDGEITTATRLASIRYDRQMHTLFGVTRNDAGLGTGIMMANSDIVNARDIFAPRHWTKMDTSKLETPIVNITNVRTKEGITRFTVNLLGGSCRPAEIMTNGNKISVNWGPTYKTPYIVLGTLFGHTDMYVGYSYDDKSVVVAFDRTKKFQPFAA